MTNRKVISLFFCLSLTTLTAPAYANVIVPLIFFFDRFYAYPSIISIGIIILIETLVLKGIIRTVKWRWHLLYALIINVVSSLIGSGLILAVALFNKLTDLFTDSLLANLLILFVLTCLIEYAVILWLYKKVVTGKQGIWVSFRINLVSYIVLFLFLTPLYITGIQHVAERLDKKRLKEWSAKEILQHEIGFIYTWSTKENERTVTLQKWDVRSEQWSAELELEKGRDMPPEVFDVSSDYIALPIEDRFEKRYVAIYTKKPFEKILTLPAKQLALVQFSKCQSKIATLQNKQYIFVQKETENWMNYFSSLCDLKIFDVQHGYEIAHFADILNEELDWSENGSTLLVVKMKDPDRQKLFRQPEKSNDFYLREFVPKIICLLDTTTGAAEELCEGISPKWRINDKEFAFIQNKKIMIYDMETKNIRQICPAFDAPEFVCSPSGNNLLLKVRTYNPIWFHKYFWAIINFQDPTKKYIFYENGQSHPLIWRAD